MDKHWISRQRRWVALGASAVAVAALFVGIWGFAQSSSVHAETLFSERHIPVADTIANTCGVGEDVVFSGAMQMVIHGTTDSADGFHFDVQINSQGLSGVGQTSGAKYELSESHRASFNFPASGGTSQTNSQDGRLIGQGPDNNMTFSLLFHLTVTPDGTTTASFTDFQTVCH